MGGMSHNLQKDFDKSSGIPIPALIEYPQNHVHRGECEDDNVVVKLLTFLIT